VNSFALVVQKIYIHPWTFTAQQNITRILQWTLQVKCPPMIKTTINPPKHYLGRNLSFQEIKIDEDDRI